MAKDITIEIADEYRVDACLRTCQIAMDDHYTFVGGYLSEVLEYHAAVAQESGKEIRSFVEKLCRRIAKISGQVQGFSLSWINQLMDLYQQMTSQNQMMLSEIASLCGCPFVNGRWQLVHIAESLTPSVRVSLSIISSALLSVVELLSELVQDIIRDAIIVKHGLMVPPSTAPIAATASSENTGDLPLTNETPVPSDIVDKIIDYWSSPPPFIPDVVIDEEA